MYNTKQTLERQKTFFNTGKTKNVQFRIAQLILLRNTIKKY